MLFITREDIIANARIDDDALQYEGALLDALGETAEQMVLDLLDRSYEEVLDRYDLVPTPIRQAAIMLATHMYENRSITTAGNLSAIPYTVDLMLKPYINFTAIPTTAADYEEEYQRRKRELEEKYQRKIEQTVTPLVSLTAGIERLNNMVSSLDVFLASEDECREALQELLDIINA